MMNRKKRGNVNRGGGPRAVRYAATITEEDDLTLRRPGVGLGRVFFVVLMMHIVAVGGILAFKWLGKDESLLTVDTTPGEQDTAAALPRQESLPPVRTSGNPIVVDHPDPELQGRGYKRYRVALNEQLPHVARQFNGSVAEYEKINGFRKGEKLYAGQWITVVDHRSAGVTEENPPAPPTADDAIVATPLTLDDGIAPEPETYASVVETPPAAPAPEPAPAQAHTRLTPVELPDSPPAEQPRLSAQPAPAPAPAPAPVPIPQPDRFAQPSQPAQPIQAPRVQPPAAPRGSGPVSPIWRQGALEQIRPYAENQPRPNSQPIPAGAASETGRNYRVVTGDTAYGISRRFGVDIQQLLSMNGLTDARQLQAGQMILLP